MKTDLNFFTKQFLGQTGSSMALAGAGTNHSDTNSGSTEGKSGMGRKRLRIFAALAFSTDKNRTEKRK